MPILTMSVKESPPAPAMTPSRTAEAKAATFRALRLDRRHDVFAVDQHRLAGKIAQGHVQGGRSSVIVDLFAGKQGVAPLFEPRRAGEVEQMAERRPGQAILRIIIEQIVEAGGEMIETFRVVGEEIDRPPGRDFDPMRFEGGKGGGDVVAVHVTPQILIFGAQITLRRRKTTALCSKIR